MTPELIFRIGKCGLYKNKQHDSLKYTFGLLIGDKMYMISWGYC